MEETRKEFELQNQNHCEAELVSVLRCLYCGILFKSEQSNCSYCGAKAYNNWPQKQIPFQEWRLLQNKQAKENFSLPVVSSIEVTFNEKVIKNLSSNEKVIKKNFSSAFSFPLKLKLKKKPIQKEIRELKKYGISFERVLFTIFIGVLFIYLGMVFGVNYGRSQTSYKESGWGGRGGCGVRHITVYIYVRDFFQSFIIAIHEDDIFTKDCALFGANIGIILAVLICLFMPYKEIIKFILAFKIFIILFFFCFFASFLFGSFLIAFFLFSFLVFCNYRLN